MQPAGFVDFGDICYRAAPGFMGIGGLDAACCTSDTVSTPVAVNTLARRLVGDG